MDKWGLTNGRKSHGSRRLQVCDNQQGGGVCQDTLLYARERRGIEGGKTLVQDEHGGPLQQRTGNVEPTALAMGELPARLTDDLPQPGGHAVEEWPEVQGAAQGLSRCQVFWLGRPAAPQEEVEAKGAAKT